ncbi:MAG TPA: aldolase, partial [Acinetobacter nosocomialis]|nr:aldolase [Acinetobacter nosocomialis]
MNKHSISFKKRIANGETLYGIFCCVASPINVEPLALAGYASIIIALE